MNIDRRYPCVSDLEAVARRRLPKFVREYLTEGIGSNAGLRRNRTVLDEVELMPRYLAEADHPNQGCRVLGQRYDAPFGVAPMGLAGLVWPNADKILATAARDHNLPYVLSTVSNITLEEARSLAGKNAWFQLYTPRDPEIRSNLLRRCEESGYETVVVTVDVPHKTRRDHDIRNGLSVPPQFDLTTLLQMVAHPRWALHMLRVGVPRFANLVQYFDSGGTGGIQQSTRFIKERIGLHITPIVFQEIRANWPGKLLVKGVLDRDEARSYVDMGADGVIVSNHGGRQLDAAPSPVTVLPRIREAVGSEAAVIGDSGIRTGLDIARMLALGADLVMMGRPFLYAVVALDQRGGDHVMKILKAELNATMGQLGCQTVERLPEFLIPNGSG